jgi:hypothetical protein
MYSQNRRRHLLTAVLEAALEATLYESRRPVADRAERFA